MKLLHNFTLKDIESSMAGMMLTGVAASVANFRIAQVKIDQMTVKILYAHKVLMDTLARIDAHIARLEKEIEELEQQRREALERSEMAFAKMHALEDLLEDIAENGWSEEKQDRLKRMIGPEAESITDEAELLRLARERIEQERKDGIEAQDEIAAIDEEIEIRHDKIGALTKARNKLVNDTSLSMAEKQARLAEVVREFEEGAEQAEHLESEGDDPAFEEKFEMDETMDLDESVPSMTLGLN